MQLEICNVKKQYKDKCAVNGVNLLLTPGVWGLLGANGAGKTTLMRMIAGITGTTEGEIRYDGVEIHTMGKAYRDIFGYLPQEFGFYPGFSVQDYLEYMATLKGLPKGEADRKIKELLSRLTLEDVKRKKISKLSGGMKRRVGIAQALLNDPEVLILDEPTSGLDPGERVRFRNLLSEFARDRIVLISTHIVSDIEYISTKNAVMKDGKVIAVGGTEDLVMHVDGKVWQAAGDTEDARTYELLQDMQTELFKTEQYVEMVLTYVRMEDMSGDLMLKEYALDNLIKQALKKYSRMFAMQKLALHYEALRVIVTTDEKWLVFVLEQILSNALKYTVEGSISIYMEDDWLVIEDTGIGICSEDLPRIFEKGFTGYNGRSDKKSTGIGLYLCKQIIEKLRCQIRVESKLGKGTRVLLYLMKENLQVE